MEEEALLVLAKDMVAVAEFVAGGIEFVQGQRYGSGGPFLLPDR